MMRAHVLLIEDDEWLGASIARGLAREFDVVVVSTLEEAVEVINEHVPDVIVADFMLGDNNALALFHELSSYEDTVRVPVVLCSTVGDELKKYEASLAHYGVVKICEKSTLTPDSIRRAVREAAAQGARQ